jgi:Rhomboid family
LESVPAYQPPPPDPPHEPILTLPGALTAYVGLIAFIHLRVLLPPEAENWTIDVFGFIPRRYDPNPLQIYFPGGTGAKVWTFVTYSLLHANLSHIFFNVLWLLPFGSALARRFGAVRFYVFMAVTAAAGALAHLVTHEHAIAPMIGASASVSGAIAATPTRPQGCRRCRCGGRCAIRACSASWRYGSASTSSSASARSRLAPRAPPWHGRPISAASLQD